MTARTRERKLLTLITTLAISLVCLCGTAGATTREECQTLMDNCTILHGLDNQCKVFLDCGALVRVDQIEPKSKRQEYLDKCDLNLALSEMYKISYLEFFDDKDFNKMVGLAQIATAYCLRAQMEEK